MQGISSMLKSTTAKQPDTVSQHQCCCPGCKCHEQPATDTFCRQPAGIVPPKDWKPDPFAGLGPELSPEEKLKKKWEDVRKPMYANAPKAEIQEETHAKKSFGQKIIDKVKDFGQKVKNFVTNLFNKNKTEG